MTINGLGLDEHGRCQHWHSTRDVVANRCATCGDFYACHLCHAALTAHAFAPMPRQSNQTAVQCGVCQYEMTAAEYLQAQYRCPNCQHEFNPACALHADIYFC
ncbi:MAG TPA: CHY zinc finger protein [Lactobacillaceae bacterium]|jgi:uncharacterized CHY-type Zn-finger protein